MQKLSERRLIHTPTNTPPVRSNCDSVFKQPLSRRDSEQNPKTSDNTSEEALIPTTQGRQDRIVPVVYVLNVRGEPRVRV